MMYFVRVIYAPSERMGEKSYPIYSTNDVEEARRVAKQLEQLQHILCATVTSRGMRV